MGTDTDIAEQLRNVFHPIFHMLLQDAREKRSKFSHYTSADVACSIIDNSEIWLRNAREMNDFNEVAHGERCLQSAWNNYGERFSKLLDTAHAGISSELTHLLDRFWASRLTNTYLLSLCGHKDDGSEDQYGRLSMWRAYGGDCNVCIVFNGHSLLDNDVSINAFGTPVLYADEKKFLRYFERIVSNTEDALDLIGDTPKDDVLNSLFATLYFLVLATKHPGFREETEWRIVHCPDLWSSDFLRQDFQSIQGVPQKIYKIPLENSPRHNLSGATVPELIDKIIVGPTKSPWAVRETLIHKLQQKNTKDAEEKVVVSDIPLRR